MAYLFLGTKATEASEHNDNIRIYSNKASAEMNVDKKYSYQLYVTFGLWEQEQQMESSYILSDELEKLNSIKTDIIRLYEEIYGKHVEKHKIISVYLKYVDESVEHIKQMCAAIDKDFAESVEDLSEIFQKRINKIKKDLQDIISKYTDPANETITNNIEELIEIAEKLKNYNKNVYQNYIDKALNKLDEYLAADKNVESIYKESFEKQVQKLITFNEFGPFTLHEDDEQIYSEKSERLSELIESIKENAYLLKSLAFNDVQEGSYEFGGEDDYEHSGDTYDLDENGKVYEYGKDYEVDIDEASETFNTSDSQAISVLGVDKVNEIKQEVENGDVK